MGDTGPYSGSDKNQATAPNDTVALKDASPLAASLVGGSEGERARRLRRSGGGYSRFVAWAKWMLPFLAMAVVVLIVAWPQLKTEDTFRIGFSSVRLTGASEPGVDNARYVGTDENRQPYSVTADLARIESNGVYNLDMPKADLTLEDGTWLVMTAENGKFQQDEHVLELDGGVNLFHDMGYEMSTDELRVDLKSNIAESRQPVFGHGPFGELRAKGLKLVNKGRIIYFTGPVHLSLYLAAAQPDDGKP